MHNTDLLMTDVDSDAQDDAVLTLADAPTQIIGEILRDWFETNEELTLNDQDLESLTQLTDIFSQLYAAINEQGGSAEDFEEWLRTDILENWTVFIEDNEDLSDNTPTLTTFCLLVSNSVQRLYMQMLTYCLPRMNP